MTLISTERLYTGRVVSLDLDQVRFPNGNSGPLEMLRHPGASAVLPFLDDPLAPDPRVILIRQFRHATGGDLWEIPAGRRDGDEPAEATARRELQEETGYRCDALRHLTAIWTAPGFTDERIHLFLATGLTAGSSALEPDESLEVHVTPWSRVLEMVRDGTIGDAKTLGAVAYAEMFVRKRLTP